MEPKKGIQIDKKNTGQFVARNLEILPQKSPGGYVISRKKCPLFGLFSYFMQRAYCCCLFSQKPPVKINTALLAKKKFSDA